MALTDDEKGRLDVLVEAERIRQRSLAPPQRNFFWLIDNIQADTMRDEALRLTTAAKDVKQLEVDDWPAIAQRHLAELEGDLTFLTDLEGKLTP